jgi:hypothetical protein
MIRKLIIALVLIAATHSKCQMLSDLQDEKLKKLIEGGIEGSGYIKNEETGWFSNLDDYTDLEFVILSKKTKN